ncbi:conserved hypothetical protein [Talaromyces stipitatus ATCC 10500]|uniref:Mitochondrial carrier protein PET8 n=1 Tax=Talaromyces stipitatus (strain ATCC 10500 / CBS 375.48 / QM 6759 / NRRL 1006) TaxID=441959 RepID=B8MQ53_TALSN|nr:uncharacterized protein TSTA_055790 [Talaromyces stipitatus ATCC 10500]EED13079.1 conserved hypothetical protein [Talaromyces stipitatus ATCC 10500]
MASLPYIRQTIRPFTATSLSLGSAPVCSSTASFSTSSIQRALKESDRNRDGLENEYETYKNENLKDVKSGKGYWREQLASESEATVKADRGEAVIPGQENFVKGGLKEGETLKKDKK